MKCPVDDTALVMSDRNGVEIDYCPTCRGVWLDRGEIDKIVERDATMRTAPQQGYQQPQQHHQPQPYQHEQSQYQQQRPHYDDDDDEYNHQNGHHNKKHRRESWLGDLFD